MGVEAPVDKISSDDAVFPPLGSNGTSVTFMVDIEFEMQQKYYVLVEQGILRHFFCNNT